MGRLLAFILVFAVFLVFIVFNLNNKCNISFGFTTFQDIPVFLTAFSSFVLGMIFTLPFALSFGRKRKKAASSDSSPLSSKKAKKFPGRGNKNSPGGANPENGNGAGIHEPGLDEIKKENSFYGID